MLVISGYKSSEMVTVLVNLSMRDHTKGPITDMSDSNFF